MIKEIIKQYNSFHQKAITRLVIEKLYDGIHDLFSEGVIAGVYPEIETIYYKLGKLLNDHPDVIVFNIKIQEKVKYNNEENRVENYLASLGVPFIKEPETYGLGKPVSSEEIYNGITNKIISLLGQDFDFKKLWSPSNSGFVYAYNYDSKKPYRGINSIMLGSMHLFDPNEPLLENPYFLTFKQVEKYKGKIKKGSSARTAFYFTKLYQYKQAEPKLEIVSYDLKKFISLLKRNKSKIELLNSISPEYLARQSYFPMLKYYNVFNGADIEGIDFDLDNFKLPGQIKAKKYKKNELITIAESIIDNYPKIKPNINFGGNKAFFRPSTDLVQLPKRNNFINSQSYYSTFFHELIHSTGVKTRLVREFGGKFGDKKYAFEELIAELGASFLCAESGILHYTIKNSAAYLKNWRQALKNELEKDNKMFFRAASKAQAAADFILQRDLNGKPKYSKIKKKEVLKKDKELIDNNGQYALLGSNKVKGEKHIGKVEKRINKKNIPEVIEIESSLNGIVEFVDSSSTQANLTNEVILYLDPKPEVPFQEKIGIEAVESMNKVESSLIEEAVKQEVKPIEKIYVSKSKTSSENRSNPRSRRSNTVEREYFDLDPEFEEIEKFLGKIERKQTGSVVVTLTSPQGGGKSRSLFQFMNAFQTSGYNCGHASLEEEPDSSLYEEKEDLYLSEIAKKNIDAPEITKSNISEFNRLIENNDVILIDSMKKLSQYIKGIDLDNDLRKKYDGKLFIIIFQMNQDGTMKGGSDAQFDGDIISFIEKKPNYKDSYIYFNKNRYQTTPLDELRYSIYYKRMIGVDEVLPHEVLNESTINIE